jgi:hypothetical protein
LSNYHCSKVDIEDIFKNHHHLQSPGYSGTGCMVLLVQQVLRRFRSHEDVGIGGAYLMPIKIPIQKFLFNHKTIDT